MATRHGKGGNGFSDRGGSLLEEDSSDTTGRYIIVVVPEQDTRAAISALKRELGISQLEAMEEAGEAPIAAEEENLFFRQLGAAVVHLDPDQVSAMAKSTSTHILAAEPERRVYALATQEGQLGQLQHYGHGLLEPMVLETPLEVRAEPAQPMLPRMEVSREAMAPRAAGITPEYLRVTSSRFTGKGIKVAVLDTGVGPHRDFVGRDITARSFIRGQSPARPAARRRSPSARRP
ncbi:hypothetical protein [Archangium violaceum]|uniref:hypothetical protein n=1 Tax=Archangium violaceum TaxID=83451 RepID=UPI0036DB7877